MGQALAESVDAKLLDEHALLGIAAERLSAPEEYLESIDERPKTITESLLADLAHASAMIMPTLLRTTDEDLLNTIRDIVKEWAERGHVIVIGHGGRSLVEPFEGRWPAFHILLHASPSWRIHQVARRFNLDYGEAKQRVLRTDIARERYVATHFQANMYDAHSYDLVVNTERVGLQAVSLLVTRSVRAALFGEG